MLGRGPQQGSGPDLLNIQVMQNRSELFRQECTRLMLETEKACKRMQDDDSKRLGEEGGEEGGGGGVGGGATEHQCFKANTGAETTFFLFSDQRIKDVQFLKKELERKLEEIILEIDALTVLQSRVVKALEACREPLKVTVLCLEER